MSEHVYLQKVQQTAAELDALLHKARGRGPRGLSSAELARLDELYRLSTIHLAQVRARTRNEPLVQSLNRLIARAHSFIYITPKDNPLTRIVRFYAIGFPRAVARTGAFHAASAAIFFFSAFIGYYAVDAHLEAAYAIMGGPPQEIRLPGTTREQLEWVLRSGRDQAAGEKLLFASFLLTHNTKVGFTAFALGIMAGIPTVFLLLVNGALMGVFAHIHHEKGIVAEMWAWLLPHGVTEIGAIILCGGAGLMLGMAILRPGHQTRARSLVIAGREAARLVMGVVPMFIAAGFIESFLRQSHMSTTSRLVFAAASAVFWAIYIGAGWVVERNAGAKTSAAAPALEL
jgi:uncharacterized membrane protein SpoIIM required for sporulation